MLAIVESAVDPASVGIARELRGLLPWQDRAGCGGVPFLVHEGAMLVAIADEHLRHDGLDREIAETTGHPVEEVIFLSRHRAKAGRPTLAVHPIGNWGTAEFGGRPGQLVPTSPNRMTEALRALRAAGRRHCPEYLVTLESTHHGPSLEVPTFFIEVGSSEREWSLEPPAQAVAEAVAAIIGTVPDFPVALGFAKGHYVPRLDDLTFERKIAFGHMAADYDLPHVTEGRLQEAVRCTPGARIAYLHRKGLPKEELRRIGGLLAAIGVRSVTTEDLDPLEIA